MSTFQAKTGCGLPEAIALTGESVYDGPIVDNIFVAGETLQPHYGKVVVYPRDDTGITLNKEKLMLIEQRAATNIVNNFSIHRKGVGFKPTEVYESDKKLSSGILKTRDPFFVFTPTARCNLTVADVVNKVPRLCESGLHILMNEKMDDIYELVDRYPMVFNNCKMYFKKSETKFAMDDEPLDVNFELIEELYHGCMRDQIDEKRYSPFHNFNGTYMLKPNNVRGWKPLIRMVYDNFDGYFSVFIFGPMTMMSLFMFDPRRSMNNTTMYFTQKGIKEIQAKKICGAMCFKPPLPKRPMIMFKTD